MAQKIDLPPPLRLISPDQIPAIKQLLTGSIVKGEQTIEEKESEILSLIILNQQDGTSLEDFTAQSLKLPSCSDDSGRIKHAVQEANDLSSNNICNDQAVSVELMNHVSEESELGLQEQKEMDLQQQEEFALSDQNMFMDNPPEFHEADAAWLSLMTKFNYVPGENKVNGYIDGEKEFLRFWETFQSSTMTSFPIRSSDKFYTDAEPDDPAQICGRALKGSPRWSRVPLVPFDGVPFVMMARKNFGCRLGKGRANRHYKSDPDHPNPRKRPRVNTSSVKVGCTAEADVLQVWRVPSLQLPKTFKSKRERRRLMQLHLRDIFDYIRRQKFEVRHYVSMPLIQCHSNHAVLQPDSGQFKGVHPIVIEKIYDLVLQGLVKMKVIKLMLEEFVEEYKTEMGIDIQRTDRSFYPLDKDIMNHIRNAMRSMKGEPEENIINQDDLETFQGQLNIEPGLQECTLDIVGNGVGNTVTVDVSQLYSTQQEIEHDGTVAVSCSITEKTDQGPSLLDISSADAQRNIISSLNSNANIIESQDDQGGLVHTNDLNSTQQQTIDAEQLIRFLQQNDHKIAELDIAVESLLNAGVKSAEASSTRKIVQESKWPMKSAVPSSRKASISTLLKEEIKSSLTTVDELIGNVEDEATLKSILKKLKLIERQIKGPQVGRKVRKKGIQGLVEEVKGNYSIS